MALFLTDLLLGYHIVQELSNSIRMDAGTTQVEDRAGFGGLFGASNGEWLMGYFG